MNNLKQESLDEDFRVFLEEFGEPTQRAVALPGTIERFKNRLPERLLEYWKVVGFSAFGNGLFSITNPDNYEPALKSWLNETSIMQEDTYHVIARSGFGDLYLWGERSGYRYKLQTSLGWIVQQSQRSDIGQKMNESAMQLFFSSRTPRLVDAFDINGNAMFERAVEKHGPLALDEVFAFEPSLIVGGVAKVENVTKRNVYVHLSLLAQFGHREVLDREALTRKAFN